MSSHITNHFFQIGNFIFQADYPDELCPPPNFLLFETETTEQTDYTYHITYQNFKLCSEISTLTEQTPIAVREDLLVYQTGTLETRLIRARGNDVYYALYKEISDTEATVFLNAAQSELFSLDTVFCSLFALEKRMHIKQGLILHCAYLQYNKKAILFSAPSGVGKSTQASLWEKYKNGKVINGDRALLLYEENTWNAYGWPVCGSSEICRNFSLPIQAIVMLSQGKTNELSTLSAMQGFTEVYSQITINGWNPKAAAGTMDLIEKLIRQIPIYHLSCTISEEAVTLLAKEIEHKQPAKCVE